MIIAYWVRINTFGALHEIRILIFSTTCKVGSFFSYMMNPERLLLKVTESDRQRHIKTSKY
jgi:hypothetical protein